MSEQYLCPSRYLRARLRAAVHYFVREMARKFESQYKNSISNEKRDFPGKRIRGYCSGHQAEHDEQNSIKVWLSELGPFPC